jgi:HK97 family phage major capsid protein
MDELKNKLAEIVAKLGEYQAKDGLTPEETEEVTKLTDEAEATQKQIVAKQKMEAVIASAQEPQRKTQAKTQARVEVGAPRRMENGKNGFESVGDFFMAIKNDPRGSRNENLQYMASQREKVGEDGGFLVPDDMLDQIQKKIEGDESLLPRTRQLQTAGNRISIPVDENMPWSGSSSNFESYWVGEEQSASESQKKFNECDIKLNKIAAKVSVTDEMLEDAPLIESIIMQDAPEVIMHRINSAIINGDGVKKPEGILNSGFGFEVAKEAGQTQDTVVFENIKKMYTHALPQAKRNGIWVHNVAVEEQLIGMQINTGATDSVSNYLRNNSIDGAPYGTIMGRPRFPMAGSLPALGDKGDIMFVDLSYYFSAVKTAGIQRKISVHALWDEDKTSYKFIFRVGGKCPFKTPAETEYGAYKLSGLTFLQDRA